MKVKSKKILSIILSAACLMTMLVVGMVTASATDDTPTYTLTTTVNDDGTVVTSVKISPDVAASGSIEIQYNTETLTNPVMEKGELKSQDFAITLNPKKSDNSVFANFFATATEDITATGDAELCTVSFNLVNGSFSPDDIKVVKMFATNINGKTILDETTVEPKYEILCDHKTTKTVLARKATCAETGIEETVCAVCETVISTKELSKTDHDYDDGVVTTEPTCTEKGIKTFTCKNCDDTYTEEISATGHNYTGKVTTEPTCTEKGVKTFTCKNCDDTYTEEISATGHNYTGKVTTEPTCTEK
ncbi:MAG: hypothetical protein ACI4XP_08585, partial [Acutalibacteraceae bacterium]